MIGKIKAWLGRGRDKADLETILVHNVRIKHKYAESITAQAKWALNSVAANDGVSLTGEDSKSDDFRE